MQRDCVALFQSEGRRCNKIILGRRVLGLLSEQGVAKNSLRGVRGAQRDRV